LTALLDRSVRDQDIQLTVTMAELEKDIIHERVVAGLANARQKGKRLGRPPIASDVYEQALEMRAAGLSFKKIGKALGIDEGMIRKRMSK